MSFIKELIVKNPILYEHFWFIILTLFANFSILSFNITATSNGLHLSKEELDISKKLTNYNPLFVNYVLPNSVITILITEIVCIGMLYTSFNILSFDANLATIIIFSFIVFMTGCVIPRLIYNEIKKIKEEIRRITMDNKKSKYDENEYSRGADGYELDIRKNLEPDEEENQDKK